VGRIKQNNMDFFIKFLQEKHAEAYPMLLDDDMPDAFNDWLGQLDGEEYIAFAEEAIFTLAPVVLASKTSEKKAKSSRLNGLKGGRPLIRKP
jgi:hypothetical protein